MSNHNILEELALCVCEVFGITKQELLTKPLATIPVDARKVFCYLSSVYADKYPASRVASYFNKKGCDVHYYVNSCEDLLTTCPEFRKKFVEVECKYLHKDFAPYKNCS